jgi:DnaJ family protein C protein 13
VGIELLEGHSGDLRWCLDFRDMDSPAIILLGDSYGKRTAEGGGFVLCPLYGRKSKAFMAASGSTNTLIISYLVHPSVIPLSNRSIPFYMICRLHILM